MARYDFVEGDTGSKLAVTINDDALDSPVDLSGASVSLNWVSLAGLDVTRPMVITDAVAGKAEYKFEEGELEPPKMTFEVRLTTPATDEITNLQPITVKVRPRIVD